MQQFKMNESTKKEAEFIEKRIVEFNEENVAFEAAIPFSKLNKHVLNNDGEIIAGINCGYYLWRCVYIDALWVKDEFRNKGLASRLLLDIERTAKEYGIHLIHLDTFDFQALDFYLKHGYEIHGILEECPRDHRRYYLKKDIG
ncbi:GNAT family N-acetyltransferase [Aureibacillus halotolerans]|uniref:Acetyltransferase (GNAT) family protein n=1 Tax=Aureibacillus halotolerans TaxID=1508390 RepID=A0A4R6TVV2_9BACI|nr:GNAT family N-acetyltransferase [Aureibacillus halotolerans]TDQ37948.1 acetyltransferase (GNAT) family protein [Aureibacillus halotolerans]